MIKAPWTAEQVDALNAFQITGRFHPFTCPNDHEERELVATPAGWVCRHCDYTQDWAHAFMARPQSHAAISAQASEPNVSERTSDVCRGFDAPIDPEAGSDRRYD